MRAILLGILLVARVAACDSTTTPVQGISGGGGGGTTTTAAVTIGDNFFSPVQDTVGVGGTVTWTWTGANRHQITFDGGTPCSSALVAARGNAGVTGPSGTAAPAGMTSTECGRIWS